MRKNDKLLNKNYICDKQRDILEIIGIPIVEHCNLNCKGCLHFCHISQSPYYADLDIFEKDLIRLKKFYSNIKIIRLYGGEPLLHNELHKFITCCKTIFPYSKIEVLTNGILLMNIQPELIKVLQINQVEICWSVYPIIDKKKFEEIINFVNENHLKCTINKVTEFYTCFEVKGGMNKKNSFEKCSGKKCHILKEGKISCCPAPLVGHLINKFGTNIDFSDGIFNIHDDNVTVTEINQFLNRPHNACRYCSAPRYFKWELQQNPVTLDDWKNDRIV